MNAVLNGAAVNSRRFFDFDRPIAARQRDLAPKREINMVCKWSGGSAAIVWENNRAAGGGEAGEFGRNFNCEHADFSIGEKLVCR